MSTSKDILKTYFQTGDFPTEAQFAELIDSFRHVDDGSVIKNFTINSNGDLTINLSSNQSIQIDKFVLPSSMPISFIDGLQNVINNSVTVSQLNDAIATSAYGIKYTWNAETERNAQTGMKEHEQGVQLNTREVYKYNGSSWVLFYTLDAVHNHDDRYYTQIESNTLFLGKTEKAIDSEKLDGLDSTAFAKASHSHTWAQITGIPTTFPSEPHTHSWLEITGKPSTFPASAHNHNDLYYTEAESDARFLGKTAKANDSDKLDGLGSTAFARTSHTHSWSQITGVPSTFPASAHNHNDLYYTEAESNARFLGKAAKATDSDKLDGINSSGFARQTLIPVKTLAIGWYTIAVNLRDRASAKFILIDRTSSRHQTIHFYAAHHYGNGNVINVLSNSSHGDGGTYRYIRIKEGSTYDGALLQVYIDTANANVQGVILENIQSSGWVVKNWIPDGTNPGSVSKFESLTNVAAQIDLNKTQGIQSTQEIFVKSNQVYHTDYKPTAADVGALALGAKATDSDKLDGISSSGFVKKGINGHQSWNGQHLIFNFTDVNNVDAISYNDSTNGFYFNADRSKTNTEANAKVYAGSFYENGRVLNSKYLGKNAKAVDSEKLNGLDSSAFLQDISNSSKGVTTLVPRDATLSTSGITTGAIKIALPQLWTNTMMKLHVDVYDYATNESITIILSGYNYSEKRWVNTSAQIIGTSIDKNFTIRFGYNDTKSCIYIGETSSKWSYLKVVITKGIFSHSNYQKEKWLTGWDIGIVTTFDKISTTHKNNLIAASNSDKFDGLESTAFFRDNVNNIGNWQLASKTNNSGYSSAALEIRELNFAGKQTGTNTEAPRISFHWGGRVASQIMLRTDSDIAIMNNPGTAYENFRAAKIYSDDALVATQNWVNGAFLGKTGKATDADKLDGLNSTQFLRSDADNTQGYRFTDASKYILYTASNWGLYWDTNSNIMKWRGAGNDKVLISLNNGNIESKGSITAQGNVYANGAYFVGDSKRIVQFTDTWLRLNPSGHFSNGIYAGSSVLRTDNQLQVGSGGASFYANSSGNGKFKGSLIVGNQLTVNGHLYGKSVNSAYSHLYRFGGIHFTWDSDSYGTNAQHSIKSSYGTTMGDSLTMNSFNNIRLNIDTNNNNSNSKFEIGHNTSGVSNVLFSVEETGTVRATGDVVAFSTSDINLKNNIIPIASPLMKIHQLSGNEFRWNKKQQTYKEGSKDYGILAQEVASVLPEAVRKNKDTGHLSVRYEKLIPLLIEGIKEQQQQINQLKTKLNGFTN